MRFSWLKQALLAVTFGAAASVANADLIPGSPFAGNDCSGVFGQGFPNCKIPANIDPNESPVIIKFGVDDGTFDPTAIEINSALFPTIDGSEFSFDFTGNASTGTWTYTPGPGDPAINFFVAKGGPVFNLFSNLGDPLSDDWATPLNPNSGQLYGLSHLTFYDTNGNIPKVPEPTTLLLLAAGILGIALTRRRSR